MRKIEDYRKHAEECRVMAGRAASEREREMLLDMAKTWESLAHDREEQKKRLVRMERLDQIGGTANGDGDKPPDTP